METYNRVVERVRGALWAHHRKLMPERQFHRILAYVYNNKYEYQIRFDKMTCVGTELGGKVEVITTPSGHIKRVRANPDFEDLPAATRRKLLISAYGKATKEGRKVMQEAEMKIYGQFMRDIKPIVMGIRDNPEFYTVPEDSEELKGGILRGASNPTAKRTIPYEKAYQVGDEWQYRSEQEKIFLDSDLGKRWSRTLQGKKYLKAAKPEAKPRGAPGQKKLVKPFEMIAPYTAMDEEALRKRNWQAFLDNKHVAETTWTKVRIGDRTKAQRVLQKTGQAWHSPIDEDNNQRW